MTARGRALAILTGLAVFVAGWVVFVSAWSGPAGAGPGSRGAGFAGARAADLVLAVDELATNTLRYTRGEGVVRIWREDATLLVEVADDGHIADPLAGRDCPPATDLGGRGLYLVNQLCDLVQLRSSPEGSVVRLHMQLG